MKADWNLHDGWQSLQEQVEEGQLFAALTNASISDVDAIDIAVSVLRMARESQWIEEME